MITEQKLNKLTKIYKTPDNYQEVLAFSLDKNVIFGFYSIIHEFLPIAYKELVCSDIIKDLLFSEDEVKIELALNLI